MCTGPLAHPLICSLAPLTRSLPPRCFLCFHVLLAHSVPSLLDCQKTQYLASMYSLLHCADLVSRSFLFFVPKQLTASPISRLWLNFLTETVILGTLGNHFRTFEAQCKKPQPPRSSHSRNLFLWWPYIGRQFRRLPRMPPAIPDLKESEIRF